LLNKKICQVMPANSFGLAMLLLLHSAEWLFLCAVCVANIIILARTDNAEMPRVISNCLFDQRRWHHSLVVASLTFPLIFTIDMRRLSRLPPTPSPSVQAWIGCQRCPPMKGELRGRGSKSVSKFHYHSINGGAVDNTWRHR
jgi:hypothetical protein